MEYKFFYTLEDVILRFRLRVKVFIRKFYLSLRITLGFSEIKNPHLNAEGVMGLYLLEFFSVYSYNNFIIAHNG